MYSMTMDVIYEELRILIGHSKFLPWWQLDGCSMTKPFLSVKSMARKTTSTSGT